jgi:hypothetical protein
MNLFWVVMNKGETHMSGHSSSHSVQTERPPRGGLSKNAISILIKSLLALSAFCAAEQIA